MDTNKRQTACSKESFEIFSSAMRTAFRISHLTLLNCKALQNTILQSQEWEEWVNVGFGTLLVNANSSHMAIPQAFFLAVKFVQRAINQNIPVPNFSCSHIIDAKEYTLQSLIQSLTIQLCVYYNFGSELTSQMHLAMPNTIFKLCRLFSYLVEQLPDVQYY